ncbi:T9SS type A sorting domain-containing protein [Crocinitomicaceae bacterium]|nr:T9SS type A sorting domain-containing protein [Crocinitomicaceae bacterium]
MSGCSAMATSDYVINVDPNCNSGIGEELQSYFDLFPNPVHGTLEIRSNETDLAFTICNGLGKKVYAGMLSEHNYLDLHFLDEGIYYISAGNTMKRFIKL